MSFEKIAEIVGHKQISTTMAAYSYDLKADEQNVRLMNSALNFTGGTQNRDPGTQKRTETETRMGDPDGDPGHKIGA